MILLRIYPADYNNLSRLFSSPELPRGGGADAGARCQRRPALSDRRAPDRYFHAGHLTDGRAALIAYTLYGEITAALFDGGGNSIEIIQKEIPRPPVDPNSRPIHKGDEDGCQEYLHREFGFSPGLIRIKEFRMKGELFAVYHLPSHYKDFLCRYKVPVHFKSEIRPWGAAWTTSSML